MALKGWTGKTLRVDLSTGNARVEETRPDLRAKYIGGRGMNARLLYEEVPAGTDPLGPGNKIFINSGPLCGTLAPGSQRITITAKSPLTGFVGDSNGGGYFGAEMKYAGYDCLIIEGAAERPCYIWIDDGKVEVRDASHLWGKMTTETRNLLFRELGDSRVGILCIGPAGENCVRFAGVLTDTGRMAARTGTGAVMGSKKLKAVAVRGTGGVEVADNAGIERTYRRIVDGWAEKPEVDARTRKYGTIASLLSYNKMGALPAYNYQQGTFENIEAVSPDRLLQEHFVKQRACFSCPLACSRTYAVESGSLAGAIAESIQLGPLEHSTSRVGGSDLALTVRAHQLCNDYGMDIMDMAGIIGMLMESYQRGLITKADLGGLEPKWGDPKTILSLIEMTGSREEGLGDILADGMRLAAEKIGKEISSCVIDVKGMSVSSLDPRGSQGWALGYAVSSRGADHCRTLLDSERSWDQALHEELPDVYTKVDPHAEDGKAHIVKWHEDLRAAQNSYQICIFTVKYGTANLPRSQAAFVRAVTGMELDGDEFMRLGERVINLERAFNVREGLSRKDDTLPERFLKESAPDGEAKGQVVHLEQMLKEYYGLRGWDKETGYPGKKKLIEMGLGDVASELEAMGKLR